VAPPPHLVEGQEKMHPANLTTSPQSQAGASKKIAHTVHGPTSDDEQKIEQFNVDDR
jgi:hypothetical protein